MRRELAMLGCAALVAGAVALNVGCGRSTGMRNADAGSTLDLAMASGGAGASGGGAGAVAGGSSGNGGATAGGSDARAVDPTQLCEMWRTRSVEQDTLDVLQFGFFKANTVLEGTLGDLVESGSTSLAALTVNRVRAGITRYEGLESDIRIDRALFEQLGKGARITLGFNQAHPLRDTGAPRPVWDQPQAAIAKSGTLPAEVFDFHAWNTPNVAVVRVEETLAGGIRFALVESLRGNLPPGFLISLSEMWPPLGLTVGSTWIGGFSELITTPTGSIASAALFDLRPNTSEVRAAVMTALQSIEAQGFATRYQAELDRLKADAIRLRLGWMYNQADVVAALEVTGIGDECCTGAGGIYHASSVVESLRGQPPAGQVLTGGHAYYAKKACGDRLLYAMASPLSLADGLGLDCTGKVGLDVMTPSRVFHELPATADNLALARQWVASAPPLLRLYPAGKQLAAEAFAAPAGTALWSTPASALSAVMAGTPTILTIESATKRSEGTVVRMRTPFYIDELTHLTSHEVEVAFACADPRLLQTGTRWIGVVVGTTTVQSSSALAPLEQGRLWLAPGLLLPERSDLNRTLRQIPSAVVK